jgi:hypothetical protein
MRGIVGIAAALILAVLVYAWVDGGREPLRDMAVPVPIPERAQ